jgi:hypothetical protein
MIFIYNTPTTELLKVGKKTSDSSRPTSGQNKTVSINRPAYKAGKKRDSIPSYNWSDAVERSVNENPMKEAGRQNRAWLKASSAQKHDTVKIINMHILKNVA